VRLGLTAKELAFMTSVSREAVSLWEMGTAAPKLLHLLGLAKALGTSSDELLAYAAAHPGERAIPCKTGPRPTHLRVAP
jgi:transcriptional regulator with XRE-family HTH domain